MEWKKNISKAKFCNMDHGDEGIPERLLIKNILTDTEYALNFMRMVMTFYAYVRCDYDTSYAFLVA
jgi:hypothetical protein